MDIGPMSVRHVAWYALCGRNIGRLSVDGRRNAEIIASNE